MKNILQRIIQSQNLELLIRIADDHFTDKEDHKRFIEKYHKENFSYLQDVKKDPIKQYRKKYDRLMR